MHLVSCSPLLSGVSRRCLRFGSVLVKSGVFDLFCLFEDGLRLDLSLELCLLPLDLECFELEEALSDCPFLVDDCFRGFSFSDSEELLFFESSDSDEDGCLPFDDFDLGCFLELFTDFFSGELSEEDELLDREDLFFKLARDFLRGFLLLELSPDDLELLRDIIPKH